MNDQIITDRCTELARLISLHTDAMGNGFHQTNIAPLGFGRESAAGTLLYSASSPMLAIVVQGKKGTLVGEETYRYGEAQYLVLSVDQPISGFIIEATPDRPYLGLGWHLIRVNFARLLLLTLIRSRLKKKLRYVAFLLLLPMHYYSIVRCDWFGSWTPHKILLFLRRW